VRYAAGYGVGVLSELPYWAHTRLPDNGPLLIAIALCIVLPKSYSSNPRILVPGSWLTYLPHLQNPFDLWHARFKFDFYFSHVCMVCPSTVQLLLPLIGTSEVVAYFCALCSRGEMWRPVGWRKFKIKFGLYRSYCSKFIYLNTRNKNLKYTMKNVLSFGSTNWTLENKCCNILTQKQIALIAAPCKLSYPLHCFTTR